jgi:hypothetical protein
MNTFKHISIPNFIVKEYLEIYLHFLYYVSYTENVTAPTVWDQKSLNAGNIFCDSTTEQST